MPDTALEPGSAVEKLSALRTYYLYQAADAGELMAREDNDGPDNFLRKAELFKALDTIINALQNEAAHSPYD